MTATGVRRGTAPTVDELLGRLAAILGDWSGAPGTRLLLDGRPVLPADSDGSDPAPDSPAQAGRCEWTLPDGRRLALNTGGSGREAALARLVDLAVELLASFDGDGDAGDCHRQLARQRQLLDHVCSSVIGMDLEGYITSWNQGAEALFGYTAQEAIGRNVLFLYADEDEDDLLAETFLHGRSREMVVRRRRRDGSLFWASLTLTLLSDEDGRPSGLMGYLMDASERVQAEEELRLQAAIFEFSGEAIVITDADGSIVSVNRAFTRIFGHTTTEVSGRSFDSLFLARDRHIAGETRFECRDTGYWMGEARLLRHNDESFHAWLSVSAVRNREGCLTHYVAMVSDVSERKHAEQQIYRLAYFDGLTGLPNRAMLYTLIRQALEEGRRSGSHGAVLFLDLDRFRRVNDVLGVAAGDELLVQVASRIRGCLRSEDVVARVGADEFVVALFDLARREHATVVAEKIQRELAAPVALVDGNQVTVSASVGVSIFPDDGDDPETLLQNASVALARLRTDVGCEKPYLYFCADMNRRALERHHLEEDLRRALEREELELWFQPQFDLAHGRMQAAEVLLRWRHPSRGLVSPGEFIPIAEETGLIHVIGGWVLDRACATLAHWQSNGPAVVRLAVNISPRQFRTGLDERVAEILSRHGVSARWLELEITESVLLDDIRSAVGLLRRLRDLGLRVALDDFGTGYSALAYLRQLPIDTLKIDRAFVCDLPGTGAESAVALAIIGLAGNLGLEVVAEGVENVEQLSFLRQHGCRDVQGYLLARPMPQADFERLLADQTLPGEP